MVGALCAAPPQKVPMEDIIPCLILLRKAARTTLTVNEWQDKKGRKKEEVLRVFDKAILLAETQS